MLFCLFIFCCVCERRGQERRGDERTNEYNRQASEYMRAAMALLEKGNFPEALKEVDKSLSAMRMS